MDDETKSCMLEGPTSESNEDEGNVVEEPPENKLTGLPGETIPVSVASLINEDEQIEADYVQEHMKSSTMTGSKHEISFTQEVIEVSPKCESLKNSCKVSNNLDNDNNEPAKIKTDFKIDKKNTQKFNEDAWDVGLVVNEYYTESDNCIKIKEKENDTLDCPLNTEEFTDRNKVPQDIKAAKETFELPLQLDSEGKFKKKATSENDDNRRQCDIDDDIFVVKPIFTNIIFLPDKSKGASPKRYGPKRLGSIYDGISEEDKDSDKNSESVADDKSLQNITMPGHIEMDADMNVLQTVAEREKEPDNVETAVSRDGREVEDLIKDGSKMNRDETNTTYGKNEETIPDEKISTDLCFVEDHFGFYTGSLAEGLSKEFRDENMLNQNGSRSSQTMPVNVQEEINNNENKTAEVSYSHTFSHDLSQQQNFERTGNLDEVKLICNEDNSKSQSFKLPTSKFEPEEEWEPGKAKENVSANFNDTFQEQEIIEICKNCREPRDECLCLFPGIKTVMPVLFDYQQKPPLAYLRYLRINDKEINWSILKSAQAIFIQRMKSRNTEISQDNRVAFKFELPASKGLSVPPERQDSVEEEFEDDIEITEDKRVAFKFELPASKGLSVPPERQESVEEEYEDDIESEYKEGISMVRSIENKVGMDISGLQLSGSFRNIIVNNFDECSDSDEEFSEGDDKNDYDYQSKDENANEERENISTADININEKSCTDVKFYDGDSYINGLDDQLESPDVNEESDFQKNQIEKELIFVKRPQGCCFNGFDRDRCLQSGSQMKMLSYAHKDKDCSEEVKTLLRNVDNNDQLEEVQVASSLSSFNSNVHDLYELRNKEESETDLVNNMAVEKGNKSFDIGNLPNDIISGDSSSFSSEGNTAENDMEIKCDITAGENEEKNEGEVTETDKNKIDKCAITSKTLDRNCDNSKKGKLLVEEDIDELTTFQSNEGNVFTPTVSSSVVSSAGNKCSENTSMEISSGLKIEIGKVHEIDGNSLSRQNSIEAGVSENGKDFLIEEENCHVVSVSSQVSVDTLETPNTNESWTSSETTVCTEQVNVEAVKTKDNLAGNYEGFNSEISDTNKDSYNNNKKGLKMHLGRGSTLRRTLTRIDEDNRLVEICSDDDDDNEEVVNGGYVVNNIQDKVQCSKSRNVLDNTEGENSEVPTHDKPGNTSLMKNGEGMIQMSGERVPQFLSSGNMGSSSVQVQVSGSSLLGDLSATGLDFSLPTDQFLKQLHERNLGLSGMLENLRSNVSDQSRRHIDRRPRRPEQAKSDFAASFYDSYDRNVDISQLGNQPGPSTAEPSQNQAIVLDSESRLPDCFQGLATER